MGNTLLRGFVYCHGRHGRRIKIMKAEGTVMKLQSPVSVKQILVDYPNHGIFEAPAGPRLGINNFSLALPERAGLIGGRLYYLIPLPLPQHELINYNNDINRGHIAIDSSRLQPPSSAGIATATDSLKQREEAEAAIEKIHIGDGVKIVSSSFSTNGSFVRVKLRLRKEDLASFLSANNVMENVVVPPLIEGGTRQPALSPWKPSLDTITEPQSPVGDLQGSERKLK